MKRVLVLLALAAAGLITVAVVASATWSAQGAGSARGIALSLPGGNTPSASASLADLTVSWSQVTFAGSPLGSHANGGYIVRRYADGSSTPITPGANCSGTISGAAATLSCVESAVPDGTWRYTVTPALRSWRGAESAHSAAVTSVNDVTPPIDVLSLVNQGGGGSYLSGSTLYYQGAAAAGGSFAIENALIDGASGPASSDYAAFGGTSTGWTHTTPDLETTPAGGPYVSNTFGWSSGTTSGPTEVVTGRDVTGNQAATTLTFVDDATAPTGGVLRVNATNASPSGTSSPNATGSWAIDTRTDYNADTGSGVATSILTLQYAPWSGNACATFGSASTIAGMPAQTATAGEGCYKYTLTGTDHVGNAASRSTTVQVDQTVPVTTDNTAAIGNAWQKTNQTVTLTPTDTPGTGVARTYSTTDGSTPTMSSPTGTSITLNATGVYTIKYFSVDNAGNQETVKTAGTQIRIDKTVPTDSVSLSSATGAYLSGTTLYFNKNTGGSFNLVSAVTDAHSGPASATFPGVGTSGWSGHTGSELVSSGTGSAPTITYTSGTYTFAVNAGTPNGAPAGTVSGADVAGNTNGVVLSYTPDTAATAPALTFPASAGRYNDTTWNAGCSSAFCGTASDAGSGVQKVEVSIQRGSGNYWNGSGFSSGSQFWNLATGTTSWSLPFTGATFPAEGAYSVTVRVTDNVGNTATAASATFTIDRTAPTATNVVMANGGTIGFADKGDSVTVTYSEGLDAATFCTGWVNDGTNQAKSGSPGGVVVTITNNGTNDTLSSVTASGCTFHFGSVSLGADYVSANTTFTGNGGNASSVTWNPTAHTLAIAFGTLATGTNQLVVLPSTPSYTPDAVLKDLAGNGIGAGPYTGSSSRF